MITEEFVSLNVRSWLKGLGWNILAFDFPQSGTGIVLHAKGSNSKNKDAILPDVVAHLEREDKGVLLEDKDRFFLGDFKKIERLRTTDDYQPSLSALFGGKLPKEMYYGIGIPNITSQIANSSRHYSKIDFLLAVSADGSISMPHSVNPHIFDG